MLLSMLLFASGKTTAIVEIILQEVKRGNKVLSSSLVTGLQTKFPPNFDALEAQKAQHDLCASVSSHLGGTKQLYLPCSDVCATAPYPDAVFSDTP